MAITVTPTAQATNVPPRVQLDISASAGETSTTITRTNPDGTIVPVRTGDGNPLTLSAGAGTLYDYEAPFGAAVTYSSLETPTNITSAVIVSVSDVWLIHPGVPALSMPVVLRPGSLQDEVLSAKQALFWPQGRSTPIPVSDGSRKAAQSTLVVAAQSLGDVAAIRALVADAGVLLLNIPDGMGTGFGASYIAVQDVKMSRWTDVVIDGNRDVVMPFYVVARPAGGSQAQRTLADLLVYATLNDLKSGYATLGDLLAGP